MSAVKISTPRLKAQLNVLINWSIDKDIEDSLKLLIDCTVIHERIGLFPTIIDRLSTENCLESLNRWSKTNSYSFHLHRLIVSYKNDPPKLFSTNIFTELKPAKTQFYGELDFFYLVSTVVERIPAGSFDEEKWFERFRLWLVVKAMHAASFQNLQDSYLRELFKYLRIAADKLTRKLDVINKLIVEANGYDQFTRMLEQRAKQLILDSDNKPNDINFLNNLIKICDGTFRQENFVAVHPIYELFNYLPKITDLENIFISTEENLDTQFNSEKNLIDIPEESEVDIGVEVFVDANQSQQLKTLKGNSVLLSTVEELQFLPWAWNKPNPIEVKLLITANDQLLNSEKEEEQILAALIWISLNTGRSFRRTLNIQITEIGDDWTLNVDEWVLTRHQPKRKNSWMPKSEEDKSWIMESLEFHEIVLPDALVLILKNRLSKFTGPKFLIQLWDEKEWGSAESQFLKIYRQSLPRLTPGMLGNFLPQKIFTATENDKLTRILASHPNTGLPPASAYSAWLKNDHPLVFNQFLSVSEEDEQNKIAVGSRLYPIESLLKKAICEAGLALEKIRKSADLIEYHNNLTGYMYTMLLASTGSRPINDLVESIGQFDFENGYFYVDDKSSSRGNKGRLVALPDQLINILRSDYLLHLRIISQTIGIEKSPLATEIFGLSQGLHSDKIPFLFFLKQSETLDWESVSASKISGINLFDWPLPANLFRHRLAKLLPAEGVHQEVVDGFLGHVESGLESYGDYSTRAFLADTKTLRPALNKLFDKLDFVLPRHQPYLKLKNSSMAYTPLKNRIFGSASRAKERKARIINAIKAAKWEIEKTIGDTPFDLIDEYKMEMLSKSMLFHANGLARSDGFLRYGYLIKCINRFSLKLGRHVKLKKQYVFAETSSPFTQLSIHAQTKYALLLDSLAEILTSKPGSRFSATDAALLSALIFSLENRVADKSMLIKAFMGTHFRIVRLQDQYYVEFSASEKIDGLLICSRRFPVTGLCANWMQKAKVLKLSTAFLTKPLSSDFMAIRKIVSENNGQINIVNNVEELFQKHCEILNQANVIELPGILAGYLSGRTISYSWNWPELIRLKMGANYRLDFERCLTNLPTNELTLATDFLPTTKPIVNLINEEGLQQGVKALFKQVRKALTNEKIDYTLKNKTREGLIKRINSLLNEHSETVSQTCLLLVLWIKFLINTKLSSSRYYATSTLERYFSALSSKFEELAYTTNLVGMDGEDITELYSDILRLALDKDRAYVGQRLLGFHRWARSQGVEEPDWSEIDIPELEEFVSPGFIFEKDYQNALQLLTRSSTQYDINDEFSGLLLLLAYRFGLRGKEALGLLASDLVIEDDMMVILVSDNRYRKLKSLSSRRQIPLVFELSACEKSIIDWCLTHLNSIPGSNQTTPLFNHEGEPLSEFTKNNLKHNVITVLKKVSFNPDITLHHARHTAVNKIAHALFPFKTVYKDKEFNFISSSLVDTLLGTVAHTRREAWASARYLGHATRSTQLKSYIHFLGDWAAQYSKSLKLDKQYQIDGVLDIDQFVVLAGELDFKLAENNKINQIKEKVTMVDLIQLFRLLANGKQVQQSAMTLGVELETANYAYDLLSAVSSKSDRIDSKDGSLGIFQNINPSAWKRLFEYIKTVKDEDQVLLTDGAINFDIEKLLPMFGARGHVVMRTDHQFQIMEAFINIFFLKHNCAALLEIFTFYTIGVSI